MREIEIKQFGFKAWIAEQDGKSYAAISPICRILGIAENRQRQKIMDNPNLMGRHMLSHDRLGRQQETLCIPVGKVARWLLSINSKKVRADIAPMLEQFQDELQMVINSYIRGELTFELMESMRDTIKTLQVQVRQQGKEIVSLRKDLQVLRDANRWSGTAASYNMHAQKALKKSTN